jgi:hypothetical protein
MLHTSLSASLNTSFAVRLLTGLLAGVAEGEKSREAWQAKLTFLNNKCS